MPFKRDDKKLIIISAIVLIVFFIALWGVVKYHNIFVNEGLVDFCTEKCGNLELAFFINNSDFLYLECNCSEEGVQIDHYFDSLTMEELTKEEIDERIAHG